MQERCGSCVVSSVRSRTYMRRGFAVMAATNFPYSSINRAASVTRLASLSLTQLRAVLLLVVVDVVVVTIAIDVHLAAPAMNPLLLFRGLARGLPRLFAGG